MVVVVTEEDDGKFILPEQEAFGDPGLDGPLAVDAIDGTMKHILGSMRLDHIYILGNPNLGYATTVNEFMEGLDRIDELLDGFTVVNSACVRRDIYDEVRERTDKSLVPLDLFLTYSWVD